MRNTRNTRNTSARNLSASARAKRGDLAGALAQSAADLRGRERQAEEQFALLVRGALGQKRPAADKARRAFLAERGYNPPIPMELLA